MLFIKAFKQKPLNPVYEQPYSVPQSTLAMHYKPKQSTSQPASQFGRPAGEHGAGRPAGPHGSGRPAGWQDCRPAGRLARSRPAGRGRNSEQIHGAVRNIEKWLVSVNCMYILYILHHLCSFVKFVGIYIASLVGLLVNVRGTKA